MTVRTIRVKGRVSITISELKAVPLTFEKLLREVKTTKNVDFDKVVTDADFLILKKILKVTV